MSKTTINTVLRVAAITLVTIAAVNRVPAVRNVVYNLPA